MIFDPATLDLLLKIVALLGVGWGVIRYFKERKRDRQLRQEELAWRKTQFALELARDFEQDERIQRCIQMIELNRGLPPGSSLGNILGPDVKSLSPEELEKRYELDRYLDFFDRLYHFTFITKALTIPDIECFLWFIRRIAENPAIRSYCEKEGYDDVLELKQKCDEYYKTYRKPLTEVKT